MKKYIDNFSAYKLTLDLVERLKKSGDIYVYKNFNLLPLITQSIYEVLTGDLDKTVKRYSSFEYYKKLIVNATFKRSPYKTRAKILLFSPTTVRKDFNGKKFNIFLDWLYLYNINGGITFWEYITPSSPEHYIDSFSPSIIPLEKIFIKIIVNSRMVQSNIRSYIKKLIEKIPISAEYKNTLFKTIVSRVSRYISAYKVFKRILSKSSHQFLFLINYYSTIHRALVKAAKDLGITVIEFQHGIINPFHIAYIQPWKPSTNNIPDYLILYGDFYKNMILSHSKLFTEDQLIVMGNYYIETLKSRPASIPTKIKKITEGKKRNGEKIVLLTSQTIFDESAYKPYIDEITKDKELFLLIKLHPGDLHNKFLEWNKNENILIINDPSIPLYELLKITDVHITISSTSAVEALIFDVPTIIIEYKGYEKVLEFLKASNIVAFASESTLIESIHSIINTSTDDDTSNDFLKPNFMENAFEFLKKLGII